MMKKFVPFVVIVSVLISLTNCASTHGAKKTSKDVPTENRMGYVMPKYNFSVDGEYSPRTARIIPGYTAITVAVANKGFGNLPLRPDKDRWRIKDRNGKWHKVIIDIQYQEPEQWDRLHAETRQLIVYPADVPPGYTQTFEVFVQGEYNLAGFDRIEFYNGTIGKKFTFTRY